MAHDLIVYAFMAINVFVFLRTFHQKRQFTKRMESEIREVDRKLKATTFNERGTRALQDHARNAFSGKSLLNLCWVQYESGLVPLDPIIQEPIYSTLQSDECLTVENLLSRSNEMVSYAIWNAIPQILTSIGIVGTFASILASLVTLSGSSKISESFIIGLVGALGTGFLSSLFGIVLAVCFLYFEKMSTRQLGRSLAGLNVWLESSFPTLTAERVLIEQSHILKNLSADMSSSISKGFSEMTGSLGPALAEVLDDETKKTIKDGVASSFTEMNAILIDIRNESKHLTDELSELRTAKREMLDNVKSMIEEQKKLQTDINLQASNLVENLQAFEKTIAPLSEVAKQVQATNDLSGRLVDSVANITKASEQIQSSLQKSEAISTETAAKFNEQIGKISAEYNSLTQNIEGWAKESNKSLQSNLGEFDKNIGNVLRQVLTLSNSLNTGVVSLERSVGKLTERPTG